jgi:hypothetical protein
MTTPTTTTIRRVRNGWIVSEGAPHGPYETDQVRVANTPEDLLDIVDLWAECQLADEEPTNTETDKEKGKY